MCSSNTRPARALLAACLVVALATGASAKTLKVGVSDDYPPFSAGGKGFDVLVAERFAKTLGEKVEWVRFRWPELAQRLRSGAFDVAMSGITWRPDRDVGGYMTRAVALGGPCVVGAAEPKRVGVNRGGILEQFARERFDEKQLRLIDDNRSLPKRLAKKEIDAAVTDSFERATFPADTPARCEPARDRKVYWVGPGRANDLGPKLDAWLAAEEASVDALRATALGGSAPWTPVDHLVDLMARRLALMPQIAATKRQGGLPIDDDGREKGLLQAVRTDAKRAGIEPDLATGFFWTQIQLAKRVQERTPVTPRKPDAKPIPPGQAAEDLRGKFRPALDRLNRRIVLAWQAALASPAPTVDRAKLVIFEPLLTPEEIEQQAQILDRILKNASPRSLSP